MRRIFLIPFLLLALAGCAGESVWAEDEAVTGAHYADGSAPSLTIYTIINTESGNGGHSAILVNAPSQRVLFDPAGSFHHPRLPERNDVVYGMTDAAVDFYVDYHSRINWKAVVQEVPVSGAVAEMALRLVEANGATPKAFCTRHVSTILSQLPGFEGIAVSMFPESLMAQIAEFPGVATSEYQDDDPDNNGYILARGI